MGPEQEHKEEVSMEVSVGLLIIFLVVILVFGGFVFWWWNRSEQDQIKRFEALEEARRKRNASDEVSRACAAEPGGKADQAEQSHQS
jgi:uncharacterized membrane protein YqiK